MVLMMNDQLKQINIAAFPQQLKDTPAWITWKREPNKDRPEEARKVPLLADGSPAAGNYQSQLQGSLHQAMNTVLDGKAEGLGFVLNGHHDYICIDLDNDEGIGEIPAELLQLTELGYTEKSISGKGLHVWIRGTIPDGYRKKKTVHIDGSAHTIEIYSSGRFMIMTGDKFNDYGIIDQQEELNKILEKYGFAADQKTPIPEPTPTPAGGITELEISKVLQRMKSSKNGREIMDLFNGVDYDHSRRSEDDKALVNHVTFYAAHNTALSKAVLLRSARRRGKWFDQRGDHTWLDLEIYESCKGDCYPIREFAKSKNELIDQLQEVGNQWREAAEEHNKPPKMDHAEIAWILKKHCRIFNIYEEDPSFTRLGVYDPDTGLYDFSEKTIGAYVIAINPRANEQQRKEVRKYLEIEAPKKTTPDCAADLVLVGNGIFDRRDKKLSPFDPEIYLPNRVTTNYVPGAKEPEFAAGDRTWKFSTWLQEITDTPEQLDYFWRIIANGITGNAVSGKAVWFYDRDGDTGKSTFGKLLKYVVGSENTSSLSIKEHEDKSRLETMYGNTLNIGHENRASDFLKNTENYKKGRTGDDLLLEAKFGRPYKAILKNFDIQMMNELPKVKELNNSFWRRIVIIAFKMFKGEKIPEVETQFIKDRRLHEFILATALQLDEITLYDTPESEALKNQAVIEGDPVADFLNELLPELESTQINSTFLFLAYQEKHWNEYGKLPDMKKNGFTRKVAELSKRFNIRQERGKMKRAALIGTDYKRTLEVIGADKGTPKLEAALMYTNATSYFERI